MADEYEQPQFHSYHEAEEEGAKKECFDESEGKITFATADTGETKDRGLFGSADRYHEAEEEGPKKECFDESEGNITFATADADVATGETKDRGLFGSAGKAEETEKKGEDELEDKTTVCETTDEVVGDETAVEATDRGLFGSFMGKKKAEGENVNEVATEFQKVNVSEEPEEKKDEKKLQMSNSSSSISSSDEEEDGVGEEEEEKKKKGRNEKVKEMVSGGVDQKEKEKPETLDKKIEEDAYVEPAEVAYAEAGVDQAEEKKDFEDEMDEKLPVPEQTRGTEDAPTTHPPKEEEAYTRESEQKEKKGIFQKIKDKIPGYQTKSANNEGA